MHIGISSLVSPRGCIVGGNDERDPCVGEELALDNF